MSTPSHRDDWLESIRSTIVTQLRSGPPAILRVARAQRTSVRTLQRLLARYNMTYSTVVDQARLELAMRQLRDPEVRLYDLAAKLGFADPGSFTRAFKRWTGRTPREFRRRGTRKQARSVPGKRERASPLRA